MTDLPINISSAPAQTPAAKNAGSSDSAAPDAAEFDNVLARQLADTANPPAASAAPAAAAKQPAEEQDSAKDLRIEDANKYLPADMLAILQAQQAATPQANAKQDTEAGLAAAAGSAASTTATSGKGRGRTTPGARNAAASAPPTAESMALSGKEMPAQVLDSAALTRQTSPALPAATLPAQTGPALTASATANNANPKLTGAAALFAASTADALANGQNPKSANPALFQSASLQTQSNTAATPNETTLGSKQGLSARAGDLTAGEMALATPLASLSAPIATTGNSGQMSISTPVSQAAWGNELGQKVIWMATQNDQTAELHLNPPQLGPLDVTLKMQGDQASAIFTSPHAAVRDAIEQALPRLREMLAENGIMLGNATVNEHSARNNQEQTAAKSPAKSAADTSEKLAETPVIHEIRGRRHNGMVDTFA